MLQPGRPFESAIRRPRGASGLGDPVFGPQLQPWKGSAGDTRILAGPGSRIRTGTNEYQRLKFACRQWFAP